MAKAAWLTALAGARYNAELELAVLERTAELADTQLDLVHRLASVARTHHERWDGTGPGHARFLIESQAKRSRRQLG